MTNIKFTDMDGDTIKFESVGDGEIVALAIGKDAKDGQRVLLQPRQLAALSEYLKADRDAREDPPGYIERSED